MGRLSVATPSDAPWVTNKKKRPKLRSAGASLLQKSTRESGEVTEIEILATIIQQVSVSHR